MQRLKSALTALAVGIVLLAALDYAASAATGHGMVLGHWNQADHKTVLKNTKQGGPSTCAPRTARRSRSTTASGSRSSTPTRSTA